MFLGRHPVLMGQETIMKTTCSGCKVAADLSIWDVSHKP
jgi:hypothetical protein